MMSTNTDYYTMAMAAQHSPSMAGQDLTGPYMHYAPMPFYGMPAQMQPFCAAEWGYNNSNSQANHYGNVYSQSAPTTPTIGMTRYTHPPVPLTPTLGSSTASKKVYTHNPYAPASNNSTPTSASLPTPTAHSSNMNMSHDSGLSASGRCAPPSQAAGSGPVYDSDYTDAVTHPIAHGITEQYAQAIGNLVATACTPRGRHLLLSVIRLQHLDKIQQIFDEVLPNVWTLATDSHGCHVLRFLIEYLQDSHIEQLVHFFSREMVLQLATGSQHTRRILQALFEHHKTPALQTFVTALCEECYPVSTTQQGCIAIMRVMENCEDAQRAQLLSSLSPYLAALAMDPYGNYVVQTVIQQFSKEKICSILYDAFEGQWVPLSCNKFGSNVMEKVVGLSTPRLLGKLQNELCFNEPRLQSLMQDGYGNFVLQSLIEASAGTAEGRRLNDLIRPLLHTSPYGHKIEAKLKSKRFLSNAANSVNVPAQGAPSSQNSSFCSM